MFFQNQTPEQQKEYQDFLKIVGSLSNLFSDSDIPYLYYRVAEKMFCRAFEAEDLSRSDVSADAKKDLLGIGLKTFGAKNHKTFQKVAEFNKDRALYAHLEKKLLIKKISELRNARIDLTENAHNLEKSIYHCILRESEKFKIFEESMDKVDIQNICNTKKKNNTITFEDGKNDYSFSLSKSTLSKRFTSKTIVHEFDVEILKNPLSELEKIITQKGLLWGAHQNIKNTIYLPLYSLRDGKVPQKSGLNLWNSGGRTRNANEVEIRIPVEVKNYFPQFFPNRDTPFNLKLPNGEKLSSKVCQQEGKGLMSNPNKLLGKWILRDVLKLQEGELFTDEKLKILGIDSVRIDKINNSEFEINFAKIGSYEQFITANQ